MRFNGGIPRIRLDLAYDGIFFSGWAAQPGLCIVEGVLTSALATAPREPVRLAVVRHINAGVHVTAQAAHLNVSPEAWATLPGRSQRLPKTVLLTRVAGVLVHEAQESLACTPRGAGDAVVTGARTVSEVFDSRFGALSRRYIYRIADAAAPRDPAWRAAVLWLPDAPGVEAMDILVRALLDEHDFLSYCKLRKGAVTTRTLCTLQWRRIETGPNAGPEPGLVTLSVVADAFCHSTIRFLVGVGLAAGQGHKSVTWPRELLDIRTHQGAVPVAPPYGPTLEEVAYLADDEPVAQVGRARTTRRLGC